MLLTYIAGPIGVIRRFRNITIVLIALFCSLLNAAAANVMGTVVDSEGAAIVKAQIVIRPDSSGRREKVKNRDMIVETDAKGRFAVNLPAGFYDVCVMADAFSPRCLKILVGSDPLTPKVQLPADPEVMKRLGDTF